MLLFSSLANHSAVRCSLLAKEHSCFSLIKFLKYSWKRPRNFADTVFRTKCSGAYIELYVTAVVEKCHLETSFFFFLGFMTNFMSICTSVFKEHKYQTILTCTQLENIYFMRRMTLFNSTVLIDYGSHVDNKLEPYTVSSITLLKNLSFRKVFRLCPCFMKNSKKRKKFTSHMHVGNT